MSSTSLSLRQIGRIFELRSRGPLSGDALVSFHTAVFEFLPALKSKRDEVSQDPLSAFGMKMDIVMHDILMRDDFLEEPQVRAELLDLENPRSSSRHQSDVDRFIHDTTALLGTLRSSGSADSKAALKRIHKRVPEVVQRLWDNRDRLNIWNPAAYTLGNNPICLLLLTYHAQVENTSYVRTLTRAIID